MAIVAGGCSEKGAPVTAPAGPGQVRGHVQLVGQLFDEYGSPLGTSTEEDASTVPVYLLNSTGTVVDSSDADDGAYEFENVAPGNTAWPAG